ncbi:hypothetical protein FB567DRAFT_444090 [Paraphoma chrysanthemicola]|uniref:Uncharacterized protein n=1 Tax=Paraphoma chrysanthemicola TaxID=798071 RepID=A0A8K0R3V7_9PLEO|nr:hypothetical protein FB567DRAFT_444090 [Paraphoma chrysanthemicola]
MDICKWLNETEVADQSLNSPQPPGHDFFHRVEKPKPVFRQKGTPTRSRSDSSLLEPQPQSHRAPLARPKPLTEQPSDTDAYSKVSCPSRGGSAESESSSQRYARKPRRKTRLERYEPSSKKQERGKYVHHSRKGESKKSRRKSKRKKGEGPANGTADTFHAKNVSGDRLTLKPREQLGIFNKGKASTAVRGRGCELTQYPVPDLVFSEMKFLQKDKGQPEPAISYEPPKKRRKRGHVHTKEGEISAYFTSARPALAERDINVTLEHASEKGTGQAVPPRHVSQRERTQSTRSAGVLPTVETSEQRPQLGFVTRGPRHESTSYVSWSESVRAPGSVPRRPDAVLNAAAIQLEIPPYRVDEATATAEDNVLSKPTAVPVTDRKTDESTERFRISSFEPPHNRVSRSHSYPRQSSSPRKAQLVDRAAKFKSTESLASPSSMPPVMGRYVSAEHEGRPRSRRQTTDSGKDPACFAKNLSAHAGAAEGHETQQYEAEASSDLGYVIQQCEQTFHARRRAPELRDRYGMRESNDMMSMPWYPHRVHEPDRVPVVRFAGLQSPEVPNFPGVIIYDQQANRQQGLDGFLYDEEFLNDEDDMLRNERDWDEGQRQVDFVAGGETGYGDEYVYEDADAVRSRAWDNSVVARGFWRPNKLY